MKAFVPLLLRVQLSLKEFKFKDLHIVALQSFIDMLKFISENIIREEWQ